jgi:hypothetical protein
VAETLAALATIPSRAHFLPRVLESLRPQVDRLHVYLNGFTEAPQCVLDLADEYITDPTNNGAERKLHWSSSHRGIYLTCDDDFCYFGGYVQRMLDAVEKWDGEAIVTAHGRTFLANASGWNSVKGPVGLYFRRVEYGRWVNYGGSGVMAFDTRKVPLPSDLPGVNCVDAQIAVWAQRQAVPMWLVPHPAAPRRGNSTWIESLAPLDPKGIFKMSQATGHAKRNEIIRSTPWSVFEIDPDENDPVKRRKRTRLNGARMSVPPRRQRVPAMGAVPLMRWDVINELLGITPERWFLEIGVQRGVCGSHVRADVKAGVDPAPHPTAGRHYSALYKMTSDRFFETLDPATRFDVVLVDGLHHADQVERDVDNALKHLSEDGFIVMHDCGPATEPAQRVPRETGVWNGDCWKAMVALRRRRDVEAFTIDADEGIGIVRKRPNPDPLRAVPRELTYADLAANRKRWLGLVSPDLWRERIGPPLGIGSVTVVTAIFGGRDEPIPAPASSDVDRWVMFTDGAEVPGWEIRRVDSEGDPRRAARRIKALALEHVEGDIVVWIDGRITASGLPIRQVLREALRSADIAGFPHPWRDCTYLEARDCAELGRAPAPDLEAQTAAYRAEGYPERGGLWNTMVLARRRSDAMVELGRAWWAELERHTLRDQVSLPVVLWRAGITPGRLGPDVYRLGSSDLWSRGWHAGGEE